MRGAVSCCAPVSTGFHSKSPAIEMLATARSARYIRNWHNVMPEVHMAYRLVIGANDTEDTDGFKS